MPLVKIFTRNTSAVLKSRIYEQLLESFQVNRKVLNVVVQKADCVPAGTLVDIRCKAKDDRTKEKMADVSKETAKYLEEVVKETVRVRIEVFPPHLASSSMSE